jgi:hypothetical protein
VLVGHTIAVVVGLGFVRRIWGCRGVIVPMVVVDVAVRVPVQDAVQVGVRVRVGILGRPVGPFGHSARFGPNVGKAR